MSPRDTSTGSVLEQMVLPALRRGGYDFRTQVKIVTLEDFIARANQGSL